MHAAVPFSCQYQPLPLTGSSRCTPWMLHAYCHFKTACCSPVQGGERDTVGPSSCRVGVAVVQHAPGTWIAPQQVLAGVPQHSSEVWLGHVCINTCSHRTTHSPVRNRTCSYSGVCAVGAMCLLGLPACTQTRRNLSRPSVLAGAVHPAQPCTPPTPQAHGSPRRGSTACADALLSTTLCCLVHRWYAL